MTDLIATCAALVGTDLPEGAGEDSRNILPALLGQNSKAAVREFAVHHSLWGVFAIRQGAWKMIPHRGSGGFTLARNIEPAAGEPEGQLYNLALDPTETTNVWQEQPDVVRRLSQLLERVRQGP